VWYSKREAIEIAVSSAKVATVYGYVRYSKREVIE